MNPTDLETLGKKIWGEDWPLHLALHMKKHPATIDRWRKGRSPVPFLVEQEMRRLAAEL